MKMNSVSKRQSPLKASFLCGMAMLPALVVAGCGGGSNNGGPTPPPPLGQCGTGSATATFVGSTTNADLSNLNATKTQGELSTTGNTINLLGLDVSNGCDDGVENVTKVRRFTLSLSKANAVLQVGQSYSLAKDQSTNAPPAPDSRLTYSQYDTANNNIGQTWLANAGTITVTAVSGNDVSFSIANAQFVPTVSNSGAIAPSTGTFTANISGRVTVKRTSN